jgi:hypothetical protein
MFHVPNQWRMRKGRLGSDPLAGNNGAFVVPVGRVYANVIASDGSGWEHVSISIAGRCPTWDEMTKIAAYFWDDTDVLVQFRPAKEDYVNCHPYTLHWWRPVNVSIATPPSILVGLKE